VSPRARALARDARDARDASGAFAPRRYVFRTGARVVFNDVRLYQMIPTRDRANDDSNSTPPSPRGSRERAARRERARARFRRRPRRRPTRGRALRRATRRHRDRHRVTHEPASRSPPAQQACSPTRPLFRAGAIATEDSISAIEISIAQRKSLVAGLDRCFQVDDIESITKTDVA